MSKGVFIVFDIFHWFYHSSSFYRPKGLFVRLHPRADVRKKRRSSNSPYKPPNTSAGKKRKATHIHKKHRHKLLLLLLFLLTCTTTAASTEERFISFTSSIVPRSLSPQDIEFNKINHRRCRFHIYTKLPHARFTRIPSSSHSRCVWQRVKSYSSVTPPCHGDIFFSSPLAQSYCTPYENREPHRPCWKQERAEAPPLPPLSS